MANILRILIVLVIFIAGVIIGNVYIPQKNFDQRFVVVPKKPQASFNTELLPPADFILKEADKYKNILSAAEQDQEEIIGFENNIKRTILQLYYKEAAANYALELLKIQFQPENTAQYIKARDEYKKLIETIENSYPTEAPKEVLVIKEIQSGTTASTQTATVLAIPSTETVRNISTNTIAELNTEITQIQKSTGTKTN